MGFITFLRLSSNALMVFETGRNAIKRIVNIGTLVTEYLYLHRVPNRRRTRRNKLELPSSIG